MYYKLHENLCLRSYQKIPHCLLIRPENEVKFLPSEVFHALTLCDGLTDTSLFLIPEKTRDLLKLLEKEGSILPCEKGDWLTEDQKLRVYENRYIRTVHWSITGKCNYRCRHCYMSAPDAKLGELSHEKVMDLIEQIDQCGIHRVSLTGGEPLVRSDFEEIVATLSQKKIVITQLYSNGKLVNEKLLDMLEKYGQKPVIDMSYDGDEGWHDWLRGMKDASKVVFEAFDLCYERGFKTSSELCIHQGNKHLLRESLNTLAKHHVTHCKTNPVSPTDAWTKSGSTDYSISLKEVMELYLDYIPKFYEDDMPLGLMLGGAFMAEKGSENWHIPLEKFDNSDSCLRQTVCGHARTVLYLSPESRMLPCFSLSSSDIQNDYPLATEVCLQKGLVDSTYMSLIDTRIADFFKINPKCNSCTHKLVCGGGCRASGLLENPNNIMASDPACCLLFLGGYAEKIKEVASSAVEKRNSVLV